MNVLLETVTKIKEQICSCNQKLNELISSNQIEFVISSNSTTPAIICKDNRNNSVIAKVIYNTCNNEFLVVQQDANNVIYPYKKDEEQLINYFLQLLLEKYPAENEKNTLSMLSRFASILKEERWKEEKQVEDLEPIKWLTAEELLSVENIDLPIKKRTMEFIRFGFSEKHKKYVLVEIQKNYINETLVDVSKQALIFKIDDLEVIKHLLNEIAKKEIEYYV